LKNVLRSVPVDVGRERNKEGSRELIRITPRSSRGFIRRVTILSFESTVTGEREKDSSSAIVIVRRRGGETEVKKEKD